MIKAIPVIAALAIAAAAPALAQERYPSESPSGSMSSPESSATQSRQEWESDQQARTPESQDSPGTVETLRERGMTAPNVQGDAVPEDPATGIPDPAGRGNPKALESVPRP